MQASDHIATAYAELRNANSNAKVKNLSLVTTGLK